MPRNYNNDYTLISILEENRLFNKGITFITGVSQEEFVSYQSLYDRSLCTLLYLQKKGVYPGDELSSHLE